MKNFRSDIIFFKDKLERGENFSFSKYADGEWAVIQNRHIDNKEFWFDPNNTNDISKRKALIESFKYKNDRYYVGISCPCCQGIETFREMRDFSEQPIEKLTWANLWVNGNYPYYIQNIIPLYNKKPIVLFANRNAKIQNLPFTPYLHIPVDHNAWEHNWNIIETSEHISRALEGAIFLFCCGPFGNILCHRLTESNPNNTYLDIGSTLNPYLKSAGFERLYYLGDNFFSRMECVWGN